MQWSPHNKSIFGSSAEDGILNIWDSEKVWSIKLLDLIALSLSCIYSVISYFVMAKSEI